jgi:hypothetical protein
LFSACDDILAPDISGKEVSVVSPVNKTEITEGRVSFRWNAMEGAEKYRVSVVSPAFETARMAIKDTVLYQDSLSTIMSFGFDIELAPEKYQWSIQAFNHAYPSLRSVHELTIVPEQVTEPEQEPEQEPEP